MKIFSNRVEFQGTEFNDREGTLAYVNHALELWFPVDGVETVEDAQYYVRSLERAGWSEGSDDEIRECGSFEDGMSWSLEQEFTYRGIEVVLTIGYSCDTGIFVNNNPLEEYDFSQEYYDERMFNAMLKALERGD